MKRAVILHGKDGHGHAHWFPWLKSRLEAKGYEVWVPDLPRAEEPDAERWTDFLFAARDWDFNDNLVIGHSAGAVEILQLAMALPEGVRLRAGILCGAFSQALPNDPEWHDLKRMFEPALAVEGTRHKAGSLVFVHAQNDPWCPLEQAEEMASRFGGELVVLPEGQHFSTALDPRFKEFPELLTILEERSLI
ncbi:MAG TPA: alpha/beta fold hydrolase [Candidatus Saccharimonadales bacterium]|nr:alpha/beta fold hydrolase [Candidatus Saccharimonadales bacterium]